MILMKSALSLLGERQQSLLTALLQHREGLTAAELSSLLSISRNAVNQHLTSLGSSGFIHNFLQKSTGGRPGKVYRLTASGLELFQRQYAFFAKLLLGWINKNTDNDNDENKLSECLSELGEQMAQDFRIRINQHDSHIDKLHETALILSELGYDAHIKSMPKQHTEIVINNCVFQKLAQQYPEFCKLDNSFLTHLLGTHIEHTECIVKDGHHCRFKITGATDNTRE